MNGCEHEHTCHDDRYRPHLYKCYRPECRTLTSGICDVCQHTTAKKMRAARQSAKPPTTVLFTTPRTVGVTPTPGSSERPVRAPRTTALARRQARPGGTPPGATG